MSHFRSVLSWTLMATLIPALATAQDELSPERTEALFGERLERSELVTAVLERNPSVTAARRAWEAAQSRVPQAESLMDPMAMVDVGPLSIGTEARFGFRASVGQEIPYPGTLRTRGERAGALAAAGGAGLEAVRRDLALEASLLYDDYALVHEALAINREHQRLVADFKRIASARYAAGLAAQQDPLSAEVEEAHLRHREIVLETRARVLAARLNALLHRPPSAPLPPPEPLEAPDTPEAEAPPSSIEGPAAELTERALAYRPELAAARARVRAREAAVELARLEGRPDFRPTTSYNSMWGTTEHRWMVGVGVSLPIWRRRVEAGVAEAEAELAAARARVVRLEDAVAAEVETAVAELAETGHIVALYTSRLLPAAGDQVESARAGFETGQNSFLALIEAEKNLRSVELGYQEVLADYHRRLAGLAHALGLVAGDEAVMKEVLLVATRQVSGALALSLEEGNHEEAGDRRPQEVVQRGRRQR